MIPSSVARATLLVTVLLAVLSCSSTAPAPEQSTSPALTRHDSTEVARDHARQLLAEAEALSGEGRTEEALARLDLALCELLEIPPGSEPGPPHLELLIAVLDEAEKMEEELAQVDSSLDVERELVELPPVEIPEETVETPPEVEDALLPTSDLPLVYNSAVESFLDAFTRPGEYRSRIELGLQRAGLFLPMIRDRLDRAGLPRDLAFLPLIESAFSIRAYSRAHAHGMWQFISSTARHYGLEVGSLIDQRRDPELSTDAAIAYLTDLYAEFGDWYLALAAYNSGSGNVRRAIRRSGSRDFWSLRRHLPRETRNYVPAFLASIIVAKRPDRYGFEAAIEMPWEFDRVEVPDALDLGVVSDRLEIPIEELRDLNPALRHDLTPARQATEVRVPAGRGDACRALLAEVPRSEWAPRLVHSVRSGESLYVIAHRYGSTVSAIRQANGLRGSLIHPGQTLIVPRLGLSGPTAPVRVAERDGRSYVVRRNDTLWDIARSFSVSVDSLCAANGLHRNAVIRPGQRLRLPGSGVSAVATSATTYRVRRGDTLSDIARRFGISVSALRHANGIRGSRIYPGDLLHIPGGEARS